MHYESSGQLDRKYLPDDIIGQSKDGWMDRQTGNCKADPNKIIFKTDAINDIPAGVNKSGNRE